MIRVYLVEDQGMIREMLQTVLEMGGEIEVVGAAPDAEQALIELESLDTDLVLMDVQLPGDDRRRNNGQSGERQHRKQQRRRRLGNQRDTDSAGRRDRQQRCRGHVQRRRSLQLGLRDDRVRGQHLRQLGGLTCAEQLLADAPCQPRQGLGDGI